MSTNYTGGTNFSWPTKADTNWDTTVDAALTTISAHTHAGGGLGALLTASSYAANSVGGPALRLANNVTLRGRNQAGSADVDIVKVNTSNLVDFPTAHVDSSTETLSSSGAASVTTTITIISAGTVFTLAAGVEGQVKVIASTKATGNASVTPSVTAFSNTVSLLPGGLVIYRYVGSEWHVIAGQDAVITDDSLTITADGTYAVATKNWIGNKGTALAIALSDGVECQELNFANIGAGTATITPATTAGTNTATVVQYGFVRYVFLGGEWRATAGAGCTLA